MNDSWTGDAQFLLVTTWLVGSTLVWARIADRARAGLPPLERNTESPATVPQAVILGVFGWILFLIGNRLAVAADESPTISLPGIQFMAAVNLLIAALLPILLTDGGDHKLADAGFSCQGWGRQLVIGGGAFLAAVWPTALLLVASRAWRSVETQHALLQALRESPRAELIAWIILSAVIAAPLAEEMLFRVVLQGWLSERLPGPAAIGLTAVLFALVHGWRDALPLVPLSLILGYVYYQTRRYWSCVVIHALFNATFLALQLLSPSEENSHDSPP